MSSKNKFFKSAIWTLTLSSALYLSFQVTADIDKVDAEKRDLALVTQPQFSELSPLPTHHVASRYIYDYISSGHYLKTELDDKMSVQILDNYIKLLDPNRSYFLAKDITDFEQYRERMDDSIRSGWLKPAFQIYSVMQKRWEERYNYALSLLKTEMDFTVEEEFFYDREKMPWAVNLAEINDYWRKRVKSDALNLKMAGKSWNEIADILSKRYNNAMRRVSQLKSEEVFSAFMNSYANTVDPHSSYFSPRIAENFDIEMKLSLEGIGAVLQSDDVYTKINSIVEAGPADKSKELSVDDKILAVGQGEEPMVDVVGWRLDDVVDLIRGKAGTVVTLDVEPANSAVAGKTKKVKIVREKVELAEQAAKSQVIEVEDKGSKARVGVIDLPKFYIDFEARYQGKTDYRSTTRDIRKLIEEMQKNGGIDALVIDLRSNGGGALDEATSLTGLFIDKGPVVQDRNREGRVSLHEDKESGTAWDGPLAVLVNGASASASEIFAGAIQDYGRGLIIGEQTFGKGSVQRVIDLNSRFRLNENQFGALKLTINKFYRISGGSTQLKGIMPDITYPDLFSRDTFGEQSYESAMVWDTIPAANYKPVYNLAPYFETLNTRHLLRIKNDPEFQYLLDDVAEINKHREESKVSLNLAQREAQQKQDKQKQLTRENQRRTLLGEKLLAQIDENTKLTEPKDAKLYETAHIMADFIDLTSSQKLAVAK